MGVGISEDLLPEPPFPSVDAGWDAGREGSLILLPYWACTGLEL
jgi:hypothetical protein